MLTMFTIAPLAPRAIIASAAMRVVRKMPSRFTCIIACHAGSGICCNDWTP